MMHPNDDSHREKAADVKSHFFHGEFFLNLASEGELGSNHRGAGSGLFE